VVPDLTSPVNAPTTYKVVFSDAPLSGTWSSVGVSNPTFFSATGAYSANEADITLSRVSLGGLTGLSFNEKAVGGALEKIYEANGTGGAMGALFPALFSLTASQYENALDQLAGETIGDLAASDVSDLQDFLDTIMGHISGSTGDPSPGATAMLGGVSGVKPAQLADGPVQIWGGGIASGTDVDATASSPAYHTHEAGLMAGVDVPLAPAFTVGLALGYNNGTLKTTNDHGSYSAFELSGYGRYDDPDNNLYAAASVGYGSFSNKLNRTIVIPGVTTGTVSGKFDSDAVALYGEAGLHLTPDTSPLPISLTPYAAISYLNGSADPYTETGSFVAPLTVAGSGSHAFDSYLGAWFSQSWQSDEMTITPSVKLAWEHAFNDNAWNVNAAFAPVPSSTFGINGSALSRDSAFITAGVLINNGDNVDFELNYQGRQSSDRSENAITGRVMFKF
jgi:uncharacterized protein with beta-barrel porin domain